MPVAVGISLVWFFAIGGLGVVFPYVGLYLLPPAGRASVWRPLKRAKARPALLEVTTRPPERVSCAEPARGIVGLTED